MFPAKQVIKENYNASIAYMLNIYIYYCIYLPSIKPENILWLELWDKSCMSLREATKTCGYHLASCFDPGGVNKTRGGQAEKGQAEDKCGWILNYQCSTMSKIKQVSCGCIFNHGPVFPGVILYVCPNHDITCVHFLSSQDITCHAIENLWNII